MGKHENIEAPNTALESVPDDIVGIIGKPTLLATEDPSEYDETHEYDVVVVGHPAG